jgi:hypothetical protein
VSVESTPGRRREHKAAVRCVLIKMPLPRASTPVVDTSAPHGRSRALARHYDNLLRICRKGISAELLPPKKHERALASEYRRVKRHLIAYEAAVMRNRERGMHGLASLVCAYRLLL